VQLSLNLFGRLLEDPAQPVVMRGNAQLTKDGSSYMPQKY